MSVIQTFTVINSNYVKGVIYILENIALASILSGGVQKYKLTNTSINLEIVVNSQSNFEIITFFPGSKSQGYICSNSGTLQTFYYNGTVLDTTKTMISAA